MVGFHLHRSGERIELDGREVSPEQVIDLRLPDDRWIPVRVAASSNGVSARLRVGGRWERTGSTIIPEVSFSLPTDAELRWRPRRR